MLQWLSLWRAFPQTGDFVANESAAETFAKPIGPFEITSLSGTISTSGAHLPLSIAGVDGKAVGGYLVHGCVMHITAQIVVADMGGVRFARLPRPLR